MKVEVIATIARHREHAHYFKPVKSEAISQAGGKKFIKTAIEYFLVLENCDDNVSDE